MSQLNANYRTLVAPLFALAVATFSWPGLAFGASGGDRHTEQGHVLDDEAPRPSVHGGLGVWQLAGGLGEIQTIAGRGRGAFGGELFVVVSDENLVVKIDPSGKLTLFADLNAVSPSGHPRFPTLDLRNTYTGGLFLQDVRQNQPCEVDADGSASMFPVLNGSGDRISSLACDPHGHFGGRLHFTDSSGALRVLRPDGRATVLARGMLGGEHALVFARDGKFGGALYVADTKSGMIYLVTTDHEPGTAAPVWSDLSGAEIEPVGLAISREGLFGRDIMYVADARSGRILMMDEKGTFQGTFATGLPGIRSIEIVESGNFRDRMIITTSGDIWIVGQEGDQTGVGRHQSIDLEDILDLLSDWGHCPPLAQPCPNDLDASGHVDAEDLIRMLTAPRKR